MLQHFFVATFFLSKIWRRRLPDIGVFGAAGGRGGGWGCFVGHPADGIGFAGWFGWLKRWRQTNAQFAVELFIELATQWAIHRRNHRVAAMAALGNFGGKPPDAIGQTKGKHHPAGKFNLGAATLFFAGAADIMTFRTDHGCHAFNIAQKLL